MTQPQFPQLQDGVDNTSSFVYEDVDNTSILGRVIVKLTDNITKVPSYTRSSIINSKKHSSCDFKTFYFV